LIHDFGNGDRNRLGRGTGDHPQEPLSAADVDSAPDRLAGCIADHHLGTLPI
jgi:hypothetical protein